MLRPLVVFATVVLAAVACVETLSDLGPGPVVGVRMSADSVGLRLGTTLRLIAFPVDESGAFRPDRDVTWSTDTPGVATVNDSGVVAGVGEGVAVITASVEGLEGRTVVQVAPAPQLGFTRDSVAFTAQAGGPDPAPDTVGVQNLGGFTLTGLTLDTIVYGAGAAGWLVASLDSGTAPTTLTLTPMPGNITVAGSYFATVTVRAPDADSSPGSVGVRLDLTAGPADALAVNDGDGQSAEVASPVATPPSVLVSDAFDNPVEGVEVTFAVTAGGGTVSGATATSDADGIARVGSWTLGTAAGTNELSAQLPGGPGVEFTATGTPGPADEMTSEAGDNQSAVAGTEVGIPPAVMVADQFGNGVPGVTVTFTVTSGGGSITGATPETDAAGIAAVGSWTLGTEAGTNTLDASADGLTGSPVTFTATGLSGAAQNLVLEAGDMQTDTVAATLPVLYAVQVTDENGNGVSGIDVGWAVTGGGGSISPSVSTTDADGIATAERVLGTTAGTQTADASVGGLTGSPVTFTATALAGDAAEVSIAAGDGQSATVNTAVDVPPAVAVVDQFGNPVPDHAVTFVVTAGGGSVDPTTAVLTDANGIAAVSSWTLGTTAGTNNNALEATADGTDITGNPATFTASATADAPASIAVAMGDGQTAVTGQNVTNPPTALVEDQYGNPVPDVTVDFSASGDGTVGSASTTTNANGMASTTWTVRTGGHAMADDGTFANTLTATVTGTALSTAFTGFAIYSYVAHVHPIWDGSGNCLGCHGGVSGLDLGPDAATSYAELVDVAPVCDDTLPADYRRVRSGGGITNTDDFSILMRMIDPNLALIGNCDTEMPGTGGLAQAIRDTIRAWIRNGAPNN